MKKLVSLLASCLILSSPLLSSAENELLNYENKGELLGIASQFAVFVEEDFGANGSDCEGKIFVGGSANLGTATWYSAARMGAEASIIVQGKVLKNFDTGDRIIVAGEDTDVQIESEHVVRGNVVDTEKEFTRLREVSTNLSTQERTPPRLGEWNQELQFIGTNKINYFELPQLNNCNHYFNYNVPYGSYVIVNVSGKHPTIYTQLYGCSYAGERISNNKDSKSKYILFNLYEAETFEIKGTGTFYGTILAPNAKGFDDMQYGAHETGSLIAKSYFGGVEFGGIGFDLKDDEDEVVTERKTETKPVQITNEVKTMTGTATLFTKTSSAATTSDSIITSDVTTRKTDMTTSGNTTTRKQINTTTTRKQTDTTTTTKKQINTTTTSNTNQKRNNGTVETTFSSGTGNPKTSDVDEDNDWQTIGFIILIMVAVLYIIFKNDKGG